MKNFIKRHWPLILSIAYLIWPLDLIPDFPFPLVGALDDTAVMILAIIREVIVYIKRHRSPSPGRKIIEGEVIERK